jgi:hypothetical protein
MDGHDDDDRCSSLTAAGSVPSLRGLLLPLAPFPTAPLTASSSPDFRSVENAVAREAKGAMKGPRSEAGDGRA